MGTGRRALAPQRGCVVWRRLGKASNHDGPPSVVRPRFLRASADFLASRAKWRRRASLSFFSSWAGVRTRSGSSSRRNFSSNPRRARAAIASESP